MQEYFFLIILTSNIYGFMFQTHLTLVSFLIHEYTRLLLFLSECAIKKFNLS